MRQSKTNIIATIGPASKDVIILEEMIKKGMDIARLNMSWGTFEEHSNLIKNIREAKKNTGKRVLILMDLPGPRVQYKQGHGYDKNISEIITEQDREIIKFGILENIDFFGVSFVGNEKDILITKKIIADYGGNQKVIAKIERQVALDNLERIIDVSDGVMVARGDLGNEIDLEKIPFVEENILNLCNEKEVFVIVATQMMLSMTENVLPTRAEVTDVAYAVLKKADAVMLSEETANGKHPVEVVAMMEKILLESEMHLNLKVDKLKIKKLYALEILDSRGNPTLKVFCESDNGVVGVASVPSGASTGSHEACELRDGDKKRFSGKGVLKAKENVEVKIFLHLKECHLDQKTLDRKMLELDGTKNKTNLGANAILGVSLAFADCLAKTNKQELYEYIQNISVSEKKVNLPTPMFNVINGGAHADSGLEVQEFMIVPVNFSTFTEKVRVGSEIFQTLKKLLKEKNFSVSVGDEGGFAPKLKSNEEALEMLVQAIKKSGYKTSDVKISMDVAASEFYEKQTDKYVLKIGGKKKKINSEKLLEWYQMLVKKFPIYSIEDPFAEDDFLGFRKMNEKLGNKILIIGDDLTVTNIERIEKARVGNAINAVLIKPNQIGSLTETLEAILETQKNGWTPVISHRSGETSDTFISDLTVAIGATLIKAGAPSRGERVAKYNRLLEIENQ